MSPFASLCLIFFPVFLKRIALAYVGKNPAYGIVERVLLVVISLFFESCFVFSIFGIFRPDIFYAWLGHETVRYPALVGVCTALLILIAWLHPANAPGKR